jgi:outer membrane protein TolC
MLRQTRSDRAAALVATLLGLRNNERQASLFETTLVPLAERVLANTRQSYAAGSAMYLEVIESQSLVLDARLMVIEARAARDKRLAELEVLLGTDIETLGTQSRSPAAAVDELMTTARKEARHDH